VDAALVEFGQEKLQLAVANERVSADEREVERTIAVDDFEDAIHQSIALEVRQLAEGGVAGAEVSVVEGITPGTAERALLCDFNGERRSSAFEDSGPRV
jgi:hypothetical protein